MSQTPPGWYDDGQGLLRWWDGTQWTEHTHDLPVTPTPPEQIGGAEPPEEDASASPTEEPPATEGQTVLDPAAALGLGEPPAAGVPDYHSYGATQTDTVPAGYPGGYAGAEPEKKSRAWVLPVVIVGALIVLVGLAALLIPMVIGLITGASGGEGSTSDEQAAADAVADYDDAWDGADCDLLASVTTTEFRALQGLDDCEAFVATAEQFDAAADDYEVTVNEITADGGTITVITEETFLQVVGDDGAELDTPIPGSVVYIYTLVDVDGAWLIDDLTNG